MNANGAADGRRWNGGETRHSRKWYRFATALPLLAFAQPAEGARVAGSNNGTVGAFYSLKF